MVKNVKISAKTRRNLKAKKLRASGVVPAVIYGSGSKPLNLEISQRDFRQAFSVAGEARLIDVAIDGKDPIKAVIKDIQRDAVKGNIIHADLYQVDMKNKIEIEIPLKFYGESKAVKNLGGTLVKNFESISAKSLPGDLIDYIEVDISVLDNFDDAIKVKDLNVPENIELLVPLDDLVAHVLEQEVEEEPEPEEKEIEESEEEAKAGEGEKADDGKKEGGEKAPGKAEPKTEKKK